eukprot:TRINITY_DN8903_c0_g2_i1.p1 TRINITY_DN8903_c0_g2~~TRINITY_DN8903_c0_g2_i1.p1  ORF type:complete len:114 (+),score=38.48 TRINITY_DN8903_c0_g2_i1:28-342(+)
MAALRGVAAIVVFLGYWSWSSEAAEAEDQLLDEIFAEEDLDKDGFLSLEEFLGPKPTGRDREEIALRFESHDKNKDGKLTREELASPVEHAEQADMQEDALQEL